MWTHPGEYLQKRFMEPLGLTASELARRCRMPRSRVSDILAGKRGISADTAMRLAALFRMEPETWMAVQAEWDLHQVAPDRSIEPLDPPGFLIGPAGATPLPRPKRPSRPTLRVPASVEAPETAGEDVVRQPVQHVEVRYADGTRALVAKPV